MKVNLGTKKFGTPIVKVALGGPAPKSRVTTDEDIDRYLEKRKARQLDEAKIADLQVATEQSKLEEVRLRNEREKTARGENTTEEGMAETDRRIEEAADISGQAVKAGVDPETAKDLATGKQKVIIMQTPTKQQGAATGEEKGGWSVAGGKPVRDPEGEYTFTQALKVAETLSNKSSGGGGLETLNWLKDNGLLGGAKTDTLTQKLMDGLAQKMIDDYLSGNNGAAKGTPAEVATLKGEIQELRTMMAEASDPVKVMEKAKRIREELATLGVIGGDGANGGHEPGKSIDEIREENRHKEKERELEIEGGYKEKLADSAGNLIELVGRGGAHEVLESRKRSGGGGAPAVGDKTSFEEIACPVCLKAGKTVKIPILPETKEFTCPSCGGVFNVQRNV